uniref:Las1-like protein n=1 Tax=Musca domestica TaxID=7370 RepID=A0A1I8MFA7_MUSDO
MVLCSEFSKVYEWLFGDNYSAATRQQALSQIRIWNLRRSTQCPAAVLATAVIVEVQQKDHPDSIYSDDDLQTLYANAFTRFFNFMSSIMQTHNMRTMYQTAKELGLESFVVDLRHICAHGQVLPPLQVLRNTAEYCIVWLHDYYWRTQLESMRDLDATRIRRKDRTELDDKVSTLCEIFDAALEGHMKGAINIKTLKRHMHGKRFHNLKEYYQKYNFEKLQDIFDHIAQELYGLVKRDIVIKDVATIYVGALLRMRYFFSVSGIEDSSAEMESLITANQTLFRMLAINGFLDDFFYALIDIAESPIVEATKRASASFWAVQILKGFKAFRQCKQMYKDEMDENTNIKEPTFSLNNLKEISEGTRELYIYSGVGMKKTILFGDHFRRPWVWVFERDFLEERLEAANEYTAPILKG